MHARSALHQLARLQCFFLLPEKLMTGLVESWNRPLVHLWVAGSIANLSVCRSAGQPGPSHERRSVVLAKVGRGSGPRQNGVWSLSPLPNPKPAFSLSIGSKGWGRLFASFADSRCIADWGGPDQGLSETCRGLASPFELCSSLALSFAAFTVSHPETATSSPRYCLSRPDGAWLESSRQGPHQPKPGFP
jgi:hypothetical protein